MKKGLVTVVVPVYKAEQYLERCISSIVHQTYQNIEVLLIDDGSPDACPHLCDAWAKRDPRVHVVHKTNEGLGCARNTGIEYSEGEYICFIDSDDYIARDTIEKAYLAAEQYGADVVCFGMSCVSGSGQIVNSYVPQRMKQVYFGEEIRDDLLLQMIGNNPDTGEQCQIPLSACCKLYSMELIEAIGWRFVSEKEIISEDFYSIMRIMHFVKSVAVVPEALYFYCENMNSVTHTYYPDRFEKICWFYVKMMELIYELNYSDKIRKQFGDIFLGMLIAVMKQEVDSPQSYSAKRKRLKTFLQNDLVQRILKEQKDCPYNLKKRLLFLAMRKRMYDLTYIFVKLRNGLNDRN